MNDELLEVEERVVRQPRTGTKICLMIAGVILVGALYFLISPVRVPATGGVIWDCGTAFAPPSDAFGAGICGKANTLDLIRAGALLLMAAVVAAGGFYTFGTTAKVMKRQRRVTDDL